MSVPPAPNNGGVRGKSPRCPASSPPLLGAGGLLLILLLLAGCGDDRPYTAPSSSSHAQTPSSPTLPDPAASSPSASDAQPDPLIGGTPKTPADPLIGHDPLQSRVMPTAHSHWLRGHLREGRLTVLLNGVRYKSFSGAVDQDITMLLRPGANTVTFAFLPNAADASAEMEVLESEHDPPIPPLVTFQAGGAADGGKPVQETKPFIAN